MSDKNQKIAKYISDGHKILDEKYWDRWDKCVPIRVNDIYGGMELECCLDIIKELNNDCTMDSAKAIIGNQLHSERSFNLVRAMVKAFCYRGEEFYYFVS